MTEQEAATSTTQAEIPPKIPPDPTDWTIENVISFISFSDSALSIHGDLFRRHVSLLFKFVFGYRVNYYFYFICMFMEIH